jgi:DNA-binding transcriptional ArsR family regulator
VERRPAPGRTRRHTGLWEAATLGLLDRVEALIVAEPGLTPEELTGNFWGACHGGQHATAEYLLAHGADLNWIGWDGLTPLDAAERSDAIALATWLRARGARSARTSTAASRPGAGLADTPFIVYRRWTMNILDVAVPLEQSTAREYASWFKALADGTRVQLVSLLARAGRPMSVGEIVAAVPVGQSTVSAHLKVLAQVGFVLVEQRGTARFYRINEACVACFPSAADVVMGRSAPAKPDPPTKR